MTALVGQSVKRKEDFRFVTGQGRYTDDLAKQGQTYAAFVRSPYPHAIIRKVDTSAALAVPGVVAVLTGADLEADGIKGLICGWMIHSKDGSPMKAGLHPALALNKVRHVGDQLAVVIAETQGAAAAGAEKVVVDYDVLPAVLAPQDAQVAGAPQLHDE
ncbi:MAG: xanthine dehydrogenase family protein molybdopterin-binding subunit, partial [Rhizomicrobium sp.]